MRYFIIGLAAYALIFCAIAGSVFAHVYIAYALFT